DGGELRLAPYEARQAAGGAACERGLQPADAEELVEADRLGHALHARGAERLEVEEAGGERVRPLADDDAAGIGQALHALRQPDGVARPPHVGGTRALKG